MTEPFQCPYAEPGQSRCPEWRCDCFIEQYPDSPFELHPEAFVVVDEHVDLPRGQGVPHDHTEIVPGCFRCDLNRDEMGQDQD